MPQAGCPRRCSLIAVGKLSDAQAQPRSAHGRAKIEAALRHARHGRIWHLLPKAVCALRCAPSRVTAYGQCYDQLLVFAVLMLELRASVAMHRSHSKNT